MNKPININDFVKNGGQINEINFINKFILITSKKSKILLYISSKHLAVQLSHSNKLRFSNYFYSGLNKEVISEYIKYGFTLYII